MPSYQLITKKQIKNKMKQGTGQHLNMAQHTLLDLLEWVGASDFTRDQK